MARIDCFGHHQSSAPYKPPLHCLNFAATVPALIQAYDAHLIKRTGLDVAIEWHLMPHIYNEARFGSQMTALEHLVSIFAQHSPDATYINKQAFRKFVAPALIRTLEQEVAKMYGRSRWWSQLFPLRHGRRIRSDKDHGGAMQAAVEGMSQGLRQINRRSLRTNLIRLLAEYNVPLDGLSESIRPLITTRNNIVHRGVHDPDDASLAHRVAEAEELLRRIVLAMLQFNGRYTTWLIRVEDRDFR